MSSSQQCDLDKYYFVLPTIIRCNTSARRQVNPKNSKLFRPQGCQGAVPCSLLPTDSTRGIEIWAGFQSLDFIGASQRSEARSRVLLRGTQHSWSFVQHEFLAGEHAHRISAFEFIVLGPA